MRYLPRLVAVLGTPTLALLVAVTPTPPAGTSTQPQDPERAATAADQDPWPEPAEADVASIDALVAALYDTVSGPVGEERDWTRLRSLFDPHAEMQVLVPGRGGATALRTMTLDEYIEQSGPYLVRVGFHESEIARTTDHWGDLAQVFTTYEGRRAGEEQPFLRGINSLQLGRVGGKWRVLSIAWQQESEQNPLPEKYLPKKDG